MNSEMKKILDKIIAECPKAWREFVDDKLVGAYVNGDRFDTEGTHIIQAYKTGGYSTQLYNFRNWYDYFDGLGIIVEIHCENEEQWGYVVGAHTIIGCDCYYPTRPEAEWNAFLEAFKIRETQL